MIDTIHDFPDSECPKCGFVVQFTSALAGVKGFPNKPGDIIICSGCGTVNKLTPTGLKTMTRWELNKLPKEMKSIIAVGVAGVMYQKVTSAGGNVPLN